MATSKEIITDVMQFAKCDQKTAKEAIKATKGQHYTQAIIYARELVACRSLPKDNNDLTAEELAKLWK